LNQWNLRKKTEEVAVVKTEIDIEDEDKDRKTFDSEVPVTI